MNLPKIGIMGGRLVKSTNDSIQSFPSTSWREEFVLAKMCGFNIMEWVFDDYDNPILSDIGIDEIRLLSQKNNVFVDSICADFFMDKKLFNVSMLELEKNLQILTKIIQNASKLGIKMVEIPLVDSSSMQTFDEKNQLHTNLTKILPISEENDVIINLETDLHPIEFQKFIESFDSDYIRANYDVGNSASLGYDLKEEFTLLSKYVSNIHVKDRLLHGSTVTLGNGDVDFDLFFKILSDIHYKGSLIIQGAREDESKIPPTETCKKYHSFVKHYLDKYFIK